jgi:hypothetical protein
MALVMDAWEEKTFRYQVYWSKLKVTSRTVESYNHGLKWTTWFLWKEVVTPADIHRWLSEICEETAATRSIVFNLVGSLNSGKDTE